LTIINARNTLNTYCKATFFLQEMTLPEILNHYINIPAGQIHYRETKPLKVPEHRLPVILLHRTPACSSSFEKVMQIAGEHLHMIAFDTPGFGNSFVPDMASPETTDYANWFLTALSMLNIDRFHLAAHHTGTHFATEMSVLAPQKVASLLLSGVMYEPDAAKRKKMRADIGDAPEIDNAGHYISDSFTLMKALCPAYDAHLVHTETLGAITHLKGRNQAFDAIYNQDFPAVFSKVTCPVMIAQACDDPLTLNGMLETIKKDHPQVKTRITGAAFLAAPEKQPGDFCRALFELTHTTGHTMNYTKYLYQRQDDSFTLSAVESPLPSPGPGEVLVKISAVSLNRRDASIRDLSYPVQADEFVPFSDAAGVIVETGSDVTQWKAGDRVTSSFFQQWSGGRLNLTAMFSALGAGANGVLAQYALLSEEGVVATPARWSDEQAACTPCAATTAWRALVTLGNIQEGDTVLIIGTGGVATFAVQIAAAKGAVPIVISSSDEKLAQVKQLGAAHGINYKSTPEWSEEVRKITKGAGVNHVVELGGAGTMAQSVASLAIDGHLAVIGALDGFGGTIDVQPLIFGALKVSAVMVGSRADHEAVLNFMSEQGVLPLIDSQFDITDIEAAFAKMNTGAFGKIVIRL